MGVREPRLVYLTTDLDYSVLVSDDIDFEPEIIYSTEETIFEFVPELDGSSVLLIVENTQEGSDLWRIDRDGSEVDLLVDCGSDRCTAPSWSPSGDRIAYSREAVDPDLTSGFSPPRLWTVDVDSGDTSELIHDNHVLQGGPTWSPNGKWLAFYDLVVDGIRILDLATSSEQVLTTGFGLIGSWSPDGNQLVYPVLVQDGDQFLATLQIVDLEEKVTNEVVGEDMGWVDVGSPRWSPSGEWILIGVLSGEYGEGRQLWILQPDGSEAHPIVVDPNYTHGGYQWDPWGIRVVFQRFPVGNPEGEPEVVLWEFGSEATVIAEKAWLPNWLP